MPTVAAMHEHVHDGACENEEVGQIAEGVRQVLGPQQRETYDQEGGANQESSRCPEAALGFAASFVA
jgi:hypothetical protein